MPKYFITIPNSVTLPTDGNKVALTSACELHRDDSGVPNALTVAAGAYNMFLADTPGTGTATAADVTAPTLLSTSPADNATDVAVGATIDLVFSETVALGTGNIILRANDGGFADLETFNAATGTGDNGGTLTLVTTTETNDTVRITPGADLANSIEHAIRVASTAVEDTAVTPNAYAGIADDTTVSFTTAAASSATYFDTFTSDTSASYDPRASSTITWISGEEAMELESGGAYGGICTPPITLVNATSYNITIPIEITAGPGGSGIDSGDVMEVVVGTAAGATQMFETAVADRLSGSTSGLQTFTETFTATATTGYLTVRFRGGAAGQKFKCFSILVEPA